MDDAGVGRHAICEFWGAANLDSVDVAERATPCGRITLIEVFVHQFTPHGVSAIAVIAESHLALHTWPEATSRPTSSPAVSTPTSTR